MGFQFNCSHCNQEIVVKFLKIGESCYCVHCLKNVVIPETASEVDRDSTFFKPSITNQSDLLSSENLFDQTDSSVFDLRPIIVAGFIFLAFYLVIMESREAIVKILGFESMEIGNRSVMIDPPAGMRLIEDTGEYEYDGNKIAIAIIDSAYDYNEPLIYCDILTMDTTDSPRKLLDFIKAENDSKIIYENISKNTLEIIFEFDEEDSETINKSYVLWKYYSCFPYYLRAIAFWNDNPTKPINIRNAIESIKVR